MVQGAIAQRHDGLERQTEPLLRKHAAQRRRACPCRGEKPVQPPGKSRCRQGRCTRAGEGRKRVAQRANRLCRRHVLVLARLQRQSLRGRHLGLDTVPAEQAFEPGRVSRQGCARRGQQPKPARREFARDRGCPGAFNQRACNGLGTRCGRGLHLQQLERRNRASRWRPQQCLRFPPQSRARTNRRPFHSRLWKACEAQTEQRRPACPRACQARQGADRPGRIIQLQRRGRQASPRRQQRE